MSLLIGTAAAAAAAAAAVHSVWCFFGVVTCQKCHIIAGAKH
jgi:hypothetical protein